MAVDLGVSCVRVDPAEEVLQGHREHGVLVGLERRHVDHVVRLGEQARDQEGLFEVHGAFGRHLHPRLVVQGQEAPAGLLDVVQHAATEVVEESELDHVGGDQGPEGPLGHDHLAGAHVQAGPDQGRQHVRARGVRRQDRAGEVGLEDHGLAGLDEGESAHQLQAADDGLGGRCANEHHLAPGCVGERGGWGRRGIVLPRASHAHGQRGATGHRGADELPTGGSVSHVPFLLRAPRPFLRFPW